MTQDDLRSKFIKFFTSSPRNHKEIPSAPLVPENDPTSLFTSSGMQPLIPYLLGEKHPLGTRLVDSQKSFRSQDIEEVGDSTHTTFFEMLGNWSLGDYFKDEQLHWIFRFLTEKLGLDPKRLYVTVFEGNSAVPKDTQSIGIWKDIFAKIGMEAEVDERIFTYPSSKNWWSRSGEPEKMPPGEPGGPDSEVFFDFGIKLGLHEKSAYKNEKCHPNCSCGRFMEIANSVFMQYQKQSDGSLKELRQKNVDFGGGLERMLAAKNDNPDIFRTDLFSPVIKIIETASNITYGENEEETRAMRIIADHFKAAVMIISDGVIPSNKTQGYVLRRLIRRSLVYGRDLGLSKDLSYIKLLVNSVVEIYQKVYPAVSEKAQDITTVLYDESIRFGKTLEKGLKEFDSKFPEHLPSTQQKVTLRGDIAFYLFETYGFPLELSMEEAKKRGYDIEENINKSFGIKKEEHSRKSKTTSSGMFKGGMQDHSEITTKYHTATHLLQQSLRQILGSHVRQRGSNITSERLRFDFSHPDKLTDEELDEIEELINKKIRENLEVKMEIMPYERAVKEGALTVPGTKYPEQVKVYTIGGKEIFSKEVCGGPHVDFTGTLGKFKIIKEEASQAGVRRIYATISTIDVTAQQYSAEKN